MFLRGKHTPSVCFSVSSSCACSVLHHLFAADVEAACVFRCQGQHTGQPLVLAHAWVSADQHLVYSSKKAAVGTKYRIQRAAEA